MTTTYRRSGGLTAPLAAAAIGWPPALAPAPRAQPAPLRSPAWRRPRQQLAEHTSSASGGKRTATTTTTTRPTGDPTRLLDEWANCMRSHGDPDQVDPTVDVTKVIQITLGAGYAGGLRGESGACGVYLSAAEAALGGGTPPAASSEATAVEVRPVHADQRRPGLSRPDDWQ